MGFSFPGPGLEARECLVSGLYATGDFGHEQPVDEQILRNDLVFKPRQLVDVPVGAQVSPPGPVHFAGAEPNRKASRLLGFVREADVNGFRHIFRQSGGDAAGMNRKALHAVFAVV